MKTDVDVALQTALTKLGQLAWMRLINSDKHLIFAKVIVFLNQTQPKLNVSICSLKFIEVNYFAVQDPGDYWSRWPEVGSAHGN